MISASQCASRIAARTCVSRASKTASGNSASERAIKPRRIGVSYPSRGNLEQLTWRLAQHLGTLFGDDDRVAQHDVASIGMVRIGVYDQGHAGDEHGIDIFQDVRLRVGKQSEAVAAHARPLAGGVFAKSIFAKHLVLGLGYIGGAHTG